MSVGYVLDTNIISEVRKPHGNLDVKSWVGSSLGPTLFLSVISIGEIRWGIEQRRRSDPKQALVLERWLARLYNSFRDRIIPITADIVEEWGRLRSERSRGTSDMLIAATAKVHGWSVVTRNVKDFADTGVTVINPFDWPSA
ncbi:type II toxin-antitoxin system VapC family toxin [Nonomuraea sp. B12E4]|uniref:type II toxin-antitoxin system VapC family toxin n=1 Tax=Nonomuraea sp. B12E4 TaxID=3153564 RepID=UPI00325EC4BC